MVDCIRFVNTWFTSNSYILSLENYDNVWVVDPGDIQPITNWLQKNRKKTVSGILLTHAHFDHIYGINDVLNLFPQCTVFIANEYGRELLFDAKKNASRYSEMGPVVVNRNALVQFFEEKLKLWPGASMSIYQTPGHSDDSVCLLIDNILLTGDTLIKYIRTVTKVKGGSVEKLEQTITILETLKGKELMVMPGHNEPFPLDDYDLSKATTKRI
jgi:glyoxylase-like metal-dependent hydrolase (beta-lactamase superfamily II)